MARKPDKSAAAPFPDDAIPTYPFAVLHAGTRGKRLYDACLTELMRGQPADQIAAAEFVIEQDWPDLLAMTGSPADVARQMYGD